MAIDPARLYSALLNTGLQQKDNPLYQVIRDLIAIIVAQNKQINSMSSSGGSGTIGPQGPAGAQGIQGLDGSIGIPGLDGLDGEDGLTVISFSSGVGGLTAAQIAARVLLDGVSSSSSSSSSSSGGSGGQGIQGPPGIPGIDGEDADSNLLLPDISNLAKLNVDNHFTGIGNQIFDGTIRAAITQEFSWVSKSFDTVYQAQCDGFVVAISQMTGSSQSSNFKGLTDSSNPPTTIKGGLSIQSGNDGTAGVQSFMMPVKKNDFYEVARIGISGSPTETMFWVPLGTAG